MRGDVSFPAGSLTTLLPLEQLPWAAKMRSHRRAPQKPRWEPGAASAPRAAGGPSEHPLRPARGVPRGHSRLEWGSASLQNVFTPALFAGKPVTQGVRAASGRARPVPSGGGSGSVGGGSQVGCGARASGGAVAGGRSVQGVRARLWAAEGCEGAPSGKGLRRARCSRCSGHGEPRSAPPPRELVPCASAAECPLPLAQRHPAHL